MTIEKVGFPAADCKTMCIRAFKVINNQMIYFVSTKFKGAVVCNQFHSWVVGSNVFVLHKFFRPIQKQVSILLRFFFQSFVSSAGLISRNVFGLGMCGVSAVMYKKNSI